MTKTEIETIFKSEYKGTNFMTPTPIKFGQSGAYLYEISEGSGFDHEPIFGVTALHCDPVTGAVSKINDSAINQCFSGPNAKAEAMAHADALVNFE